MFRETKLKIPRRDCTKIDDKSLKELINHVISLNLHHETGAWGRKTVAMRDILSSIGDLLSKWQVAFDHTTINYGKGSTNFKRAPKGTSNVFQATSTNTKLCMTYVLCVSKHYGVLPGYYIIPEKQASKALIRDLQAKGEISNTIYWETNESGWANKYSGLRITRMILNDLRFRKALPVRILTDAHKSSTTEAVKKMLREREARMQFVLSGATQYTQFMDIRGGAAQALKNGGDKSIHKALTRYYDKNQESKYVRRYSQNGNILAMRIQDVIKMTEEAIKTHVSKDVIKRSWDAVGIDLLPDLKALPALSKGLQKALLHTPVLEDREEEVAAAWEEMEKVRQKERDARKIDWECPHCSNILTNSTYKITNGKHKGLTIRQKHLKICVDYSTEEKESLDEEVSSTEERIREGDRIKDMKYDNRVKKCPYNGCKKVYKGQSTQYFKQHIKTCSFKNQKELGNWVMKTSRKYDFDLKE